jgi:hypothetical protein
MAAERIFADHRLHALHQTIETAPHVCSLRRQPDPRAWRTIQRLQTRQTDHDSNARTDNNRHR